MDSRGGFWRRVKHTLMKYSLERILSFGVKSHMPQKQIMVVYAGYSLLGALLLMLPFASKGDISFVDHLFTSVSAFSTTGLATAGLSSGILLEMCVESKIVLIALMYIGRVGVITFGNVLISHKEGTKDNHEDDIAV